MIRSLILYTQLFSRIPLPIPIDLVYLRRGVPVLPLYGLLFGLLEAAVFIVVDVFLPTSLAWFCILFLDVLLTGGFHLDGLADTADGLFSSRSPDRMLEIMKDSRIGSNGVLALIFYYGFFLLAIPYLPAPHWKLVVFLSMIGKTGLCLQLFRIRYVRQTGGTTSYFQGTKDFAIYLSQIYPCLILFLTYQLRGLIAFTFVLVGNLCYRRFVLKKIKGHTGDTLGAAVEISQILLLLGLVI